MAEIQATSGVVEEQYDLRVLVWGFKLAFYFSFLQHIIYFSAEVFTHRVHALDISEYCFDFCRRLHDALFCLRSGLTFTTAISLDSQLWLRGILGVL